MDTRDQLTQNDYPVNIEDIMHTAYLQYSLSVNVGRAIPDVRDGLKPVNRRILYVMRQRGLTHSHAYSKCASVVGEVMGEYHPHGDQAIYDTLVRMAQDFAMRAPLVDGQGNFGSIDGDPPAAYRYTECRMTRLAEELLTDLDKDTVDTTATFDEVHQEPTVLPAGYPNLLVNGATGIGVGMATNIPPHNLGEVIDATVHLIDNPTATPRELMQFIKGPDFPTGAAIAGVRPLIELYETGHGIITVRAKATIEETADGGERIVITEIPYALSKETLITKIADMYNSKVIPGIAALNDYSSSRVGIRIVVDVKKNDMATIVLNQLYKHTPLQGSFGAQFLVVDKNRPRTLNLVQILQAYLDHRLEVITRRCRYELAKAEARAHILEGLLVAVDNIDETVRIIRASRTREEAAEALEAKFKLTRRQTQAILDMRLHQLTGLARDDLREEFEAISKDIERLRELLGSRDLLIGVVRQELLEVREKYAEERRTEITAGENEINIEDLIQRGICVITVSNTGYVKRLPVDEFRTQRRGGKGVIGMATKEDDYVEHVFCACTHDYILFFSDRGLMHWLKVYEIPEAQRAARGKAIVNLLGVEPDEQIRAMMTVPAVDVPDRYLVFATRNGYVKKTQLSAFKNLWRRGIRAIVLQDDDDLIDVQLTDGDDQVMLFSAAGMACRFPEDQVRAMGRAARGVIGIRLKSDDDRVVAMQVVRPQDELLNITALGMGKRSNIGFGVTEQDRETGGGYRLTKRGSQGVISIRLKGDDLLVGALKVIEGSEILMTTIKGQVVRFCVDDIRSKGRASQGVIVMDLKDKDRIGSVSSIEELAAEEDDEDPSAAEAGGPAPEGASEEAGEPAAEEAAEEDAGADDE